MSTQHNYYLSKCITGEDSELSATSDNSCNFCCDHPTVSPHNCNIYINKTQGQFEAPPYPYTTCNWLIEVPSDHEVLVRLTQVSEFTGERFAIYNVYSVLLQYGGFSSLRGFGITKQYFIMMELNDEGRACIYQ